LVTVIFTYNDYGQLYRPFYKQERRFPSTTLHAATTQKTVSIFTAVKTSNYTSRNSTGSQQCSGYISLITHCNPETEALRPTCDVGFQPPNYTALISLTPCAYSNWQK